MEGDYMIYLCNIGFTTLMIISIILFVVILSFSLMMMFGTKLRSKMLSRQIESLRGATNMSKEDMETILTNLGSTSIKARKRIIEENKEDLKDVKDMEMEINRDAIKETAKAVKEGFTESETIYCKHCGKEIDTDSTFCKYCGKNV